MKIHFIGIGGIGVSALAKYYLEKGCHVTGSDLISSEITDTFKKLGVKISIGKHQSLSLKPVDIRYQQTKWPDLVIYSPAVQSDNPELRKAKKLGIKTLSYPEALGELTKQHFTIAISGTHGKSTTTAMIGVLLAKAGFDPTVIVGTKVKEFASHQKNGEGSNCRTGKSKYLVIEADEHLASFLNYWPKIIAITNIEADHLDYYKNIKNIEKAFNEFANHLPKDGALVANTDDKNVQKLIKNYQSQTFSYSQKQKENLKLKKILKIPGEHNVSNALAALTIARILKIPDKISFKALSEYKGSWRRFDEHELKFAETSPHLPERSEGHSKKDLLSSFASFRNDGTQREMNGIQRTTPNSAIAGRNEKRRRSPLRTLRIISDYGHHPTEIRVTLKAAREKYPKKKIWCIYQPHQYQRTYYLFNDFVKVFRQTSINKIIITDIYDVAGREKSKTKKKVNSEKLVKTINKKEVIYLAKEKIIDYLKKNLQGEEVIIIMGAGDIYLLANSFKR